MHTRPFLPADSYLLPFSTLALCLAVPTLVPVLHKPVHPPRNLPTCCQKWMRLHWLHAVLCISVARGPQAGRDLLQQMVSYSCFHKGRFVAKGKGSRKARGNGTLQRHVSTPKHFSSILLWE